MKHTLLPVEPVISHDGETVVIIGVFVAIVELIGEQGVIGRRKRGEAGGVDQAALHHVPYGLVIELEWIEIGIRIGILQA